MIRPTDTPRVRLRTARRQHALPRLACAALIALLGQVAPATAQSQPGADDSRVAPEGPYRSRMRIVEPRAAASANGSAAPPDTPYARALAERAAGYAAAARGEDRAAVVALQGALAAAGLAPLAERQIRGDLVRLWLRLGDDAALLEAYTRWDAAGFELDAEERVAVAHAAARQQQFALARSSIEAALRGQDAPPRAWRDLQVYILARSGAPLEAARIKATLMDLQDASRADWLQLATLYDAAGRDADLLAALELGYRAGRLDRASDVLTLAAAYRRGGLPRDAADLLAASLASGVLSDEAAHWQRLAEAWLAAREDAAALAPLARAAALADTPALSYALGQLHYRLGNFDEASTALRRALRGDLAGDTGRAWLLLGEALLAQDRRREARKALAEAATLGGSYRQAQALLATLDAGSDGEPDAAARRTAGEDDDPQIVATGAVDSAADAGTLAQKTVPRQRFYYTAETVSSASLPAAVADMIRRLRGAVRRERLAPAGPLQIVAPSMLTADTRVELQVGIPVRTRTAPRGEFHNRDLLPWRCAWREYRGPVSGLDQAWRALLQDLAAAGLVPDGETRTVVRDFAGGPEDTLFELQVGILSTAPGSDGS